MEQIKENQSLTKNYIHEQLKILCTIHKINEYKKTLKIISLLLYPMLLIAL